MEFLDYVDSEPMGAAMNGAAGSFCEVDVEEEHADVLTVYDEVGITGHPDHVQVHRVGVRAVERSGTGRV